MNVTKVYVASSWKNNLQPYIVDTLKGLEFMGVEVYDFRNPCKGNHGFSSTQGLEMNYESNEDWSFEDYRKSLDHPLCEEGFKLDFEAVTESEICVMVLPCGKSAHLEAGCFVGGNKRLIIYSPLGMGIEFELMYKMADLITDNLTEILIYIEEYVEGKGVIQ